MSLLSARMTNSGEKAVVCKYNKFGYCKFRDSCKRLHLKETCENGASCASITSCQKRHPRVCKIYEIEQSCRFGSKCSYFHSNSTKQKETDQRLKFLENRLDDMSSKIESLEGELEKIRANGNDGENKVKEISSKENEKMNVFKCNICQYKTDKEVTLQKHKNT